MSWLLRLATRLGLSLHALGSDAFGLADACAHTRWWCRPDADLLARISERTGVSVLRLREMTFGALQPPYRADEDSARFVGRRYLSWATQERAYRFAVCGHCLEGDKKPYLRNLWLIGWMAVCPHHGTILIERCNACGARVRVGMGPFSATAPFSPGTCARCGASLLDGQYRLAHPSATRMQTVLLEGKQLGVVSIPAIGELTWPEMVALVDVVIGMVWTDLTREEQLQVFRLYTSDLRQNLQACDAVYDCRHASLQFLAWLLDGWPYSEGAQVARCMLMRWSAAQRNRLCRHLRPRWTDAWTAGSKTFSPPIVERLRALAGSSRRRMSPAIRDLCRPRHRTPEVLIKVVSPGSNVLDAIEHHFRDIDQRNIHALERDDGAPFRGKGAARRLMEDWGLDALSRRASPLRWGHVTPPKLIHKVILSMPSGTPPEKLLEASRNFAQEQLAPLHRYVLALHTDERHPHVHLVVRAMNENGVRLNIRKPMLREWRREFARHLCALGVAAKATEQAGRLRQRVTTPKGIYRPGRASRAPRLPERPNLRFRDRSIGHDNAITTERGHRR